MSTSAKPDPARGVFETLLVLEGEPVELDAHMERLAASLDDLFGASMPIEIVDLARERAAGLRLGRLRLTVAPRADGLACDAIAEAADSSLHFPDREHGAMLQGIRLPGGLGDHKWADRSRLPKTPTGTVLLLLDADDEVLEAGRANVFLARDGALATPPLDGRILAGVTRATVIEAAHEGGVEVQERRIGRDELLDADEVFLTGSVRGIEPARALDGIALGAEGDLSQRLAASLRRRWSRNPEPVATHGP
jgi:para-aminobenzoate synthetase/4-amino-4-deoxychorismate lyase